MKKQITQISYLQILAFLLFSIIFSNNAFTQTPFVGIWEGALEGQGMKIDLSFTISAEDKNQLSCTMDIPMQGAKDIAASAITTKGQKLSISYEMMSASYEGQLSKDEKEIQGTWSQHGMELELNLTKVRKAKGAPVRPQEPTEPFPYEITELHFHNEAADHIELAGTLTMPEGEGPFPAVVLISGSGPQNRDEELMGHKPFWIIADHFSRNGIAVLRYDDRGVEYSQGDFSTSTSADFASDAAAAVQFLKQNPKIKSDEIGLCGHSEGGMIAPMAAANSDDYAFLVLMAGPGQNIVELLLLQSELISRSMGETEENIRKGTELNKRIYPIVVGEGSQDERKAKLKQLLKSDYENSTAEEQRRQGSYESKFAQMERQLFNPWMEYFLKYDPIVNLKKVSCPVLAINGENDLQVAPKENLSGIRAALEAGLCDDFTIKEFEGLNHLFQHSETGSPMEYAQIEETIAPEVLSFMTTWIQDQVK
ncbi:MAG: alpha/beta hydrolase family protein [Saprospiraceae bacterium]